MSRSSAKLRYDKVARLHSSFTSRLSWLLKPSLGIAVILAGVFASPAAAQMINTETPFVSTSDSYYENFGLGFGFNIPGGRGNGSRVVGLGPQGQLLPNILFRQNNGAVPPFGGFTPGAGAQFGFGRVSPNGGGFGLNFNFAKGNTRTNVTQAPSITTMNGASGSISDITSRPFVIGNVPVVGSINHPPVQYENGVHRALRIGRETGDGLRMSQATESYKPDLAPSKPVVYGTTRSSANTGAQSVDAIKAQRRARLAKTESMIEAAITNSQTLLADGKNFDARIALREALKLTDDEAMQLKLKRLIKATRVKR